MTTDSLIERLTLDLRPVRPRRVWKDGIVLAVICVLELAVFLMVQPQIYMSADEPSFWWRLVSTGAIASVGGVAALLSLDPTRSVRPGLRLVGLTIMAAFVAGWVVDAARDGSAPLLTRLDWHNGITCAAKVIILSLPAAVGLGWLMRRGAPLDVAMSSFAAGLAAAAWGAFVFVFACPFYDPLYLAVWYGAGCAVVTGVARLVLPWVARW